MSDIFDDNKKVNYNLGDEYLNHIIFTEIDALEVGMEPEEDTQYSVAPFNQEVFDKILKENRPDIALLVKDETSMELD